MPVMALKLMQFQKDFIKAVEDPRYDTVVLSGPRSLSKSFLAAKILTRALSPGDTLYAGGHEVILAAATLDTARYCYNYIQEALEPLGGYRFQTSITRMGITHLSSGTKLRVMSSNAKGSFGIVGCDFLVLDEPGSLEVRGGQALWDSISTSQGKVGSNLKVILTGTLGRVAAGSGHWWYDLCHKGTTGKTWVKLFRDDLKTWDKWSTIRRANPLIDKDVNTREKIKEERAAARHDSRLKARFMTFRENIPTSDESESLLTADEWLELRAKPAPAPEGSLLVGIDLGSGRAYPGTGDDAGRCVVGLRWRGNPSGLFPGTSKDSLSGGSGGA